MYKLVCIQYCNIKGEQPSGAAVPPVCCSVAVVVFLSEELYSHCSNLPSCMNGDLAGYMVTWGCELQ